MLTVASDEGKRRRVEVVGDGGCNDGDGGGGGGDGRRGGGQGAVPRRAAPVLPPKKGHPSVSVYLVPAKANCPPAVVVRPSCEQERFLVRRRRRERNRERIESDFGSVREKFRRKIQLACCSSTIADFFGAARKDPALISEPVNCLKQTKGEN